MRRAIILGLLAVMAHAATTTVTQTIIGPDGSPMTGDALIRLSSACASGSDYAGPQGVDVQFTSGAFSANLVPTDACPVTGGSGSAWSSVDSYSAGDRVRYVGGAYVAVKANADITPGTDKATWRLISPYYTIDWTTDDNWKWRTFAMVPTSATPVTMDSVTVGEGTLPTIPIPGPPGQSVVASVEAPGANCATGGVKFVAASGTTYACNGAVGATGPQGATGAQGVQGIQGVPGNNGQSVTVQSESAGSNCTYGGEKLTSVSGTAYVCNGAPGAPGSNGSNGQSVTVTVESAGANCTYAGFKLVSVSGTAYVCNGAPGATGSEGIQGIQGVQGPAGPSPTGSGNKILATPADGSSGVSGLRALVPLDIPTMTCVSASGSATAYTCPTTIAAS